MNEPDAPTVMQEIARLKGEIEFLGRSHEVQIARLRQEIQGLEARVLDASPRPVLPPPVPVMVETPPERLWTPPEAKAPAADDPSTELSLGRNWFVRIGVAVLITGLVFLGNYAYQNWIRDTSNGVRLAALFACALVLVESGRRIAARPGMRHFGDVLLAGGMAFFYYCSYAAHSVPKLQVIENPVLAALLLLAAAVAISVVAWRRDSKAIATLGFVLASYATMLQPLGWLACISNVLIAAGGLACLMRPGWSGPGWASMLGSYGSFLGWQLSGLSGSRLRPEDPVQLWFLAPLWLLFALPGVLDRFQETLVGRGRFWFTATNNALFFLLFSWVWDALFGWGTYWKVPTLFGPVLLVLSGIGRGRAGDAADANRTQGLAFCTLALVLKLKGFHLPLALSVESLLLACAAWCFRTRSEAFFALLAGVLATAILCPLPYDPRWVGVITALLLAAAGAFLKSAGNPVSSIILTLATALVLTFSWSSFLATHWIDSFAVLSMVLLAASLTKKAEWFTESALLLGLAVVGLVLGPFMAAPWSPRAQPGWDGILVVTAAVILAVRPGAMANRAWELTACAASLAALWATWQTTLRLDWNPVAVLWTVLGFAWVSLGLWRGIRPLRAVGIALLVLALGKLFLVDVWDFSAFLRVVSFILLGVCLIVLGLFYNRFSEALTALVKDRGKE